MSDIHRLLDEAFDGVTMTPELQDLKEELRGNLSARADELQSRGMDAVTAASTAVAELDVRELIAGLEYDPSAASAVVAPGAAAAAAARLHRVQPKPWFVVRAAIAAALIAVGLLHLVPDLLARSLGGQLDVVVIGVLVAVLVADSLAQETARHYPLPLPRGIRWGVAGGLLATGLGYGAIFAGHPGLVGLLIAAVALAVLAIIAFISLGVTQTNRLKPWALEQNRRYEAEDRFSRDPAAAARFGIYTVVIWTVAIAAFVALSIAVGFVWSWLALVAGVVVFFLVLSRMLFGANEEAQRTK